MHGKTATEALPTPAAVRKAEQEIAEFRNYQQFNHELVEVSEQICRLRPVEETLTPEKKTAETIRREVAREVDQLLRVIFQERRKTGRLDLEATEMALRSAMHRAGAAAFRELPEFPAPAAEQRSIPCACDRRASYQELRSKPVLTPVGEVTVSRPYYLCAHCHRGQISGPCRTGHPRNGILTGRSPHARHRGTGEGLQSRPPADETTR